MPKVSVCIPTYNRRDYICETIESVLAQTFKDYEIVVVDDGSTDGTGQMLEKVGYPVRYHWQQNCGDAAARNKLIEMTRGRFITFIDSDDLLMPDAVERMMKVAEAENEEVIVYGPYLRIDQDGNVYGCCKRKLYSGCVTRYLFQDIFVHSCGSMFPKKALGETGGFDESLPVCADYDLWLRMSLKYRFIALPGPTFKRRRHSGNLSSVSSENRIVELRVLERFYYKNGGQKVVPQKDALRRLSKEAYRAGNCALSEGNYKAALSLLEQSFRRYPNIKSLTYWSKAAIKAHVGFLWR